MLFYKHIEGGDFPPLSFYKHLDGGDFPPLSFYKHIEGGDFLPLFYKHVDGAAGSECKKVYAFISSNIAFHMHIFQSAHAQYFNSSHNFPMRFRVVTLL